MTLYTRIIVTAYTNFYIVFLIQYLQFYYRVCFFMYICNKCTNKN